MKYSTIVCDVEKFDREYTIVVQVNMRLCDKIDNQFRKQNALNSIDIAIPKENVLC